MAKTGTFYYIRVNQDFYNTKEMQMIMMREDGPLYSYLLQRMYLLSLSFDGRLMINESIAYDTEDLALITKLEEDFVATGIKLFTKYKLLEILDNGVIYMTSITHMSGREEKETYQRRRNDLYEKMDREKELIRQGLDLEDYWSELETPLPQTSGLLDGTNDHISGLLDGTTNVDNTTNEHFSTRDRDRTRVIDRAKAISITKEKDIVKDKVKDNDEVNVSSGDDLSGDTVSHCAPAGAVDLGPLSQLSTIEDLLNYIQSQSKVKHGNKQVDPVDPSNIKIVQNRLDEGYTLAELKRIVDMKAPQFNSKATLYKNLNPNTLFNNQFYKYAKEAGLMVNQPKTGQFSSSEGTVADTPSAGKPVTGKTAKQPLPKMPVYTLEELNEIEEQRNQKVKLEMEEKKAKTELYLANKKSQAASQVYTYDANALPF